MLEKSMNSERLKSDIEEVLGDVRLLEEDVATLKKDEALLLEEIRQLERELDQDEKVNNDGNDIINDAETYIPDVFKHSHFDASISKYFVNADTKDDGLEINKHRSLAFKRAEAAVELKENIMYENIFRLGGITAFPLNRYLFNDTEEIFGIRFDNFSGFKGEYLIPHYVILRKVENVTKDEIVTRNWQIYKHTLPVYVPYNEYELELTNSQLPEDEALLQFTMSIRSYLVSTQYKHDKLDLLSSMKHGDSKIFTKIEKDLQAQRIVIDIAYQPNKSHQIELICSQNLIEIVNLRFHVRKQPQDLVLACETILKNTTFKDLKKNFRKVVDQLERNDLLAR